MGDTHCYFGLDRLGSGWQPSCETREAVETMAGRWHRLNPVSWRQQLVGEVGEEHAGDLVCLIWGLEQWETHRQ
jgi:hypothetical protein